MRKLITLMVALSVAAFKTYGQEYSLYSNQELFMQSAYLKDSITLKLHLPETLSFSAETTKYPITIIFDSQHERTYPQIIHSFDLLTSETQIPESIIIGVPFNRQNRLYLTSDQKIGKDSLSGIERLELFLFNEVIPLVQGQYKGNDFISIIGHSRTAFLVNYLSFKRPGQVDLAVALSGFFNDDPLSIEKFSEFLTEPDHFLNRFHYYYTAGTTLEESTYLIQDRQLDSLLKDKSIPENVNIVFSETGNANHITNYWVSLPPILIDAFSAYNSILDTWFFDKLNNQNIDFAIHEFEADLAKVGTSLGTALNPNLTHIYSLASHFAYKNKDYNTAIAFFELGIKYFPEYLDFYIEIIEYYKTLNNIERVRYFKSVLREKTINSSILTSDERDEIFEYLDEE